MSPRFVIPALVFAMLAASCTSYVPVAGGDNFAYLYGKGAAAVRLSARVHHVSDSRSVIPSMVACLLVLPIGAFAVPTVYSGHDLGAGSLASAPNSTAAAAAFEAIVRDNGGMAPRRVRTNYDQEFFGTFERLVKCLNINRFRTSSPQVDDNYVERFQVFAANRGRRMTYFKDRNWTPLHQHFAQL